MPWCHGALLRAFDALADVFFSWRFRVLFFYCSAFPILLREFEFEFFS
jgi:hypothetical protein